MQKKGRVILVGAGPGDAGLLTLRGLHALQDADVVLCDRLVGGDVLSLIPDSAILIDVGKNAGRHPVPQDEINAMLLRYAKEGKRVVRLKGGDPYLFGRGAEELEAVIEANIPFEVVPGVTSAVAVPACAGIPVTHREFASSVHIITAHRQHGGEPEIDFPSLVNLGGTLVFLMGVGEMQTIAAGLLEAGMDAETPAALIENGTRQYQRKIISTVGEIAQTAEKKGFKPPSILVVGKVCALAEKLDWHPLLPLHGVNVVVTRPKAAGGELSSKLRALGAAVTDFPCIRTEPLPLPDGLFCSLGECEWIVFTSPVGVRLFFSALLERGLDIRILNGVRIAAIGAKTASAVRERGLLADFYPETYNAEDLAKGLLELANPGARALLFRAEAGTPALFETLVSCGFAVEDIAAYDTIFESPCADEVRDSLSRGAVNYVTFTSASTVQGFVGVLPGLDYSRITGVCIGAETAREARKHGFRVIVSEAASIDSMVEIIKKEREK